MSRRNVHDSVPSSRYRRLVILSLIALLVPILAQMQAGRPSLAQEVPELQINSKRYIVIDADTGEVYAQRDADQRVAMASLTKIFTAIEAIESAPLDTMITTTEDDLVDPTVNSIMGFDPGEVLSLEELLYGLMLPSGNDAALAIARSLGYEEGDTSAEQSVQRFVDRMNQRNQDMGLTNTHLMNPHGWGVPGHYSTARDIAAFTRYALQFPAFVDLISTYEYTTAEGFPIYNNNWLLTNYEYIVGGKTGYDWDAGWCLVEVARRDGMTMISVTLDGIHDNRDWYDDNRVLLEYGFEQKAKRLAEGGEWTGDVAKYVDPDAAVLSRTATTSGAIGTPVTPSQPSAEGASTDAGVAAAAADGSGTSGGSAAGENTDHQTGNTSAQETKSPFLGSMGQRLIAFAAAILVIVFGAIAALAFKQHRARSPRPIGYVRR